MVRAGRPGPGGAWRSGGLTCQQHQQLPQAVLVQVQGILLPASFLFLQPQGHRSFWVMAWTLPALPGPLALGTNLGHGSRSHFQGSEEARFVPGHLWDEGKGSGEGSSLGSSQGQPPMLPPPQAGGTLLARSQAYL